MLNDVNTRPVNSRVPSSIVYGILGICLLPFILNRLGIDFGSTERSLDLSRLSSLPPDEIVDSLFHRLSGAFTHTILEWSAFIAAIFTVILSFIHFSIKRDVTMPIIGLALFCAGCMDAFHTLAADRLIQAVADNRNLIPFTWAICRFFNALIMIVGVGVFLFRGDLRVKAGIPFIVGMSLIFGAMAYSIIHICATSQNLPQTMFPNAILTRPWDIGALILFLLAGTIFFPRFYTVHPNIFSHALVISIIPQVVTQVHMAFGSTLLFDNHFNIAHFLKIIAYLVPFMGLMLDYVRTYKEVEANKAQLEQAYSKLKETSQMLVQTEKLSAMGTMAAGMAHELNNPIMGILNYIQYSLKHTKKDAKVQSVLTNAETETKRCSDIIKDLLTISHYGDEDPNIRQSEDCAVACDRVINLLAFRIQGEGVSVHRKIPKHLSSVWVKPHCVEQVFLNLMTNALDAVKDKTKKEIQVEIDQKEKFVEISISDSGTGIDSDIGKKIYDPFFTTKPPGQGTGLGLSLCRTLIQASKGQIDFTTTHGKGTTFKILLPMKNKETDKNET